MLGVNQLDFINYANALKGNYRKGIHKMEAIMASPTHAKEFASNLGGVSVVLSVPIGKEDRNSAQLLDLLLNSDVADDAVYTWLGQFYEFSSWDDLLGDEDRCNEIMNDPLKSRAVSGSGVAVGKMVATIAGLSCSAYADMSEVAASSAAMTALAASSAARAAIEKSQTAKDAIAASDVATAKYAVGAAGLNPADYANMSAVASSSAAMTALAASSAAMAAVAASSVSRNAIMGSNAAKTALASSPLKKTVTKNTSNNWENRTISTGKGWVINCYNANSGGEAGSTWYNLDGTQYKNGAGTVSVNRFFISSFSIYWWSSTSSVTYIPC